MLSARCLNSNVYLHLIQMLPSARLVLLSAVCFPHQQFQRAVLLLFFFRRRAWRQQPCVEIHSLSRKEAAEMW